jgi:transposase
MKRVGRNLGKKYSEGRKRRLQMQIARLHAQGRRFGVPPDPRTHVETRVCELPECGKEFQFKVFASTDPKTGRYCCQRHAQRHSAILRRAVPGDYALLFDLYHTKGMSTVEIAKMFGAEHHAVIARMRDFGIARRKVGHSRKWICAREGCHAPVLKLKHPQNGSTYGTLCGPHYREHRKWLYTSRYERIKAKRGNIPDRVLKLVAEGCSTSNEIAKRLDLPIKVVSTTMGRLHRAGKVESFGHMMINRAKASLWRVCLLVDEREAA